VTLLDVDLADPGLYEEAVPHEVFAHLRREDPLHWQEWSGGRGFWSITRHADLVAVHRDWATFSSEVGGTAIEDLDAESVEARKSMIDTDPPRHTRLRGIVNRGFTPRAVLAYEQHFRAIARSAVEDALRHEAFDFVEEVAAAVPIRVLAEILGVPRADHERLIDWGDRMLGHADPDLTDVMVGSEESERYRHLPFRSPAALELWEYGHALAQQRRREPGDDLVSKLVFAEIDGAPLTPREFDTMFLLLVVAGNETTRQALASGMLALIEHPDELERLRAEPALMPTAVDEIVRWATPVLHFRRTAMRDVELHGKLIRAGDKVVTWYVSANRDDAVFADPFRLDLGRRPNEHVSFGRGGPHFCLGAHLAKLEIRVVLEELLPRLGSIELAGAPRRLRSNFTNGYKTMPVRVTRA
jgi:cytochrome P450